MRTFLTFPTKSEAQAYADQTATDLLPLGPGDVTRIWDIPRELTIGQWVVAAAPGDGIEWQSEWTLKNEI